MVLDALRSKLGIPFIWKLFNRIITYPDASSRFIENYIRPTPGMVIVDLGCGTADILEHLPSDVVYYGVDSNAEYIDNCKQKYGERGQFLCIEIGKVPSIPVVADAVLALGVLHHLSDEEAAQLCQLAHTTLRPAGRLVTIDGCYTPGQSWIQRWLLDNDRGKFVRNKEGYRAIVSKFFSELDQKVVPGYMRLPYTHNIMVCTKK